MLEKIIRKDIRDMYKCENHILQFTTIKNNIFFTSDTHFNHENIIKYCSRPYVDKNEMNEDLIKRWNSVVKENDIVFHLGDFMSIQIKNILKIVQILKDLIF